MHLAKASYALGEYTTKRRPAPPLSADCIGFSIDQSIWFLMWLGNCYQYGCWLHHGLGTWPSEKCGMWVGVLNGSTDMWS